MPQCGPVLRIVCGQGHKHADPLHPLGLLRPRNERPRRRRGANQGDKLAALHVGQRPLLFSSADAGQNGGRSRRSADPSLPWNGRPILGAVPELF
jgi:hypothetical protein